MTLQDKII